MAGFYLDEKLWVLRTARPDQYPYLAIFTIVRELHGVGSRECFRRCLDGVLSNNLHLNPIAWNGLTFGRKPLQPMPIEDAIRQENNNEWSIILEFDQGLHSNFAPFLLLDKKQHATA
jgi:hypothetical protein